MLGFSFTGGLVTSRNRAHLTAEEMQQATGGFYKPGDTQEIHKISGRTAFGTVSANQNVKSLALCQFDSGGTDALLAYYSTVIRTATPGISGSFSDLITGLSSSATRFSAAHAYNKWYLANGYDRNNVLKSNGTTRGHGMIAPQDAPTCVASLQTSATQRPTASASASGQSMTNPANCYDVPGAGQKITSTFGYWQTSVITGTPASLTFTTFGASTAANRKLTVTWEMSTNIPLRLGDFGTGGQPTWGSASTVLIEYSVNSGSTFATLDRQDATGPTGIRQSSIPISANSNAVQVRITWTFGSFQTVTCRVYDIRISNGSSNSFSTTTGFYYAYTEVDANNALESVASNVSDLITLTTQNQVTITFPGSSGTNSNATHRRLYRTFDGGTAPQNLGVIADVPIGQVTFYDDFVEFDKDTQPTPLYPLLAVTIDGGTVYVPRDGEPPVFSSLSFWRGSLIGFSRVAPRSMSYSFAGRPDSFPVIYVMESWPMPEHDTLVGGAPCGDSFIIFGADTVMAIDDLPRVVQGTFSNVDIRPLRSQPGAVNPDAIVSFSVAGEPRVAWVSRFGLYQTNGSTASRISLDLNWNATTGLTGSQAGTIVLRWDPSIQCLVLGFDVTADGFNDRYYYVHMAPEHQKDNGQPKWTGPHYGFIQSMTSGTVSGVYRRWSGNGIDGKVYLEENGTTDASNAYTAVANAVPLILITGRRYGPEKELGVYKASMRHTDFGGAETCAFAWTSGRDSRGTTQTKTTTLSITGNQITQALVNRQGEWHELSVTHTGAAGGAIGEVIFDNMAGERPGRVA